MAPFYCLSALLRDKKVQDERWVKWCQDWAEWVMTSLPRTKEGGFAHSESCPGHTDTQ